TLVFALVAFALLVCAPLERPLRSLPWRPGRFQIDLLLLQLFTFFKLVVLRITGPTPEALDQAKGLIFAPGHGCLHGHVDRVDVLPVFGETQVFHAMEELEFDAPTFEDFVEGREDGIPHACLHLPAKGALVVEKQAQAAAQRCSGRQVWVVRVAAGKAKNAVIDTPDRSRPPDLAIG